MQYALVGITITKEREKERTGGLVKSGQVWSARAPPRALMLWSHALGPRTALRCAWVVCPFPPLGPLTPRPLPSAGAARRGRDRARQEGGDRAPRRQSAGTPQAHRRERAGGAALSELAASGRCVLCVARATARRAGTSTSGHGAGGSQLWTCSGGRTCARKQQDGRDYLCFLIRL